MARKVTIILVLLSLALGVITANAKGGDPKQNTQPSQAATEAAKTCEVMTGIDGGTVNLRACAGTMCAVMGYVTEGERLTIREAGGSTGYASLWVNVTTSGGVTGYINSKYCEGK